MNWKFILFLLIAFLLIGCSKEQEKGFELEKQIEAIRLSNISKLEDLSGDTYTFELYNNSEMVISQNVVYFTYPVLLENGSKSNHFKIEATGNKLNIKPKESIYLKIFVPSYIKSMEDLDLINPQLEIKGYLNGVEEKNYFIKQGSLDDFD